MIYYTQLVLLIKIQTAITESLYITSATVESLNVKRCWADALFAIHEDMKSHSFGFGTLGKVAFYTTLTTQKLNKASSTVVAAEILPQVLWTTSFLRH